MNNESGGMTRFFGGLFLTVISGLLLVAAASWLLAILWEYPITLLVLSCIGLVAIFSYVGFVFFRTGRTEQVQEDAKESSPGEAMLQEGDAEHRGGQSQAGGNKMNETTHIEVPSNIQASKVPQFPTEGLSERELEVLELVAAGRTNSEIANELYLSHPTVRQHITNIRSKLQGNNRAEALDKAFAFEVAEDLR